jgi:hypothetical protein
MAPDDKMHHAFVEQLALPYRWVQRGPDTILVQYTEQRDSTAHWHLWPKEQAALLKSVQQVK